MPRWEEGKLHLEVFDQVREIAFPHASGDSTPLDLIPTARAISKAITAISIERAVADGFSITCGPGCGACCRQLVPISPLEATALVDVVSAMPEPRQTIVRERFATAIRRLEEAKLLDPQAPRGRTVLVRDDVKEGETDWQNASRRYYALKIACPFLENESCGIYADRPMICREYHVVTPVSHCETLDERTQAIPWPVRMSEVLTAVFRDVPGGVATGIAFVLALEVGEARGASFRTTVDGESTAQHLVDKMVALSEETAPLRNH